VLFLFLKLEIGIAVLSSKNCILIFLVGDKHAIFGYIFVRLNSNFIKYGITDTYRAAAFIYEYLLLHERVQIRGVKVKGSTSVTINKYPSFFSFFRVLEFRIFLDFLKKF